MEGDVEGPEASAPGMRATREGIAEVRDGRSVVTIRREEVASIALGRGIAAERPIVEGLVGVAMLVSGVWLAWGATSALVHGQVTRSTELLAVGGGFLIVIGAVLLARVVRVCDLVQIVLRDGGRRKLAFLGGLTAEERRRFAARLRELGWSVTAVSDG